MKAKELAELLMQHPENDVVVAVPGMGDITILSVLLDGDEPTLTLLEGC